MTRKGNTDSIYKRLPQWIRQPGIQLDVPLSPLCGVLLWLITRIWQAPLVLMRTYVHVPPQNLTELQNGFHRHHQNFSAVFRIAFGNTTLIYKTPFRLKSQVELVKVKIKRPVHSNTPNSHPKTHTHTRRGFIDIRTWVTRWWLNHPPWVSSSSSPLSPSIIMTS